MKFKIGDVFWKSENAGFVGERLLCRIPDDDSEQDGNREPAPCFLCDDPNCVECANIEVINPFSREREGYVYHVSECQMELEEHSKSTQLVELAEHSRVEMKADAAMTVIVRRGEVLVAVSIGDAADPRDAHVYLLGALERMAQRLRETIARNDGLASEDIKAKA